MKTVAIALAIYLVVTFLMLVFWVWWCTRDRRSSYEKVMDATREQVEMDSETFESVINDPDRIRNEVLKNRLK